MHTIKQHATILITHHEGFRSTPYNDGVSGVITIGWGTTLIDGKAVGPTQEPVSKRQAIVWVEQWIDHALGMFADNKSLPAYLTPWEVGAIISLAYNEGGEAVEKSTLMHHIHEHDTIKAACEFPRWCMSRGAFVEGLLTRRRSEMYTFLSGNFDFIPSIDYMLLDNASGPRSISV